MVRSTEGLSDANEIWNWNKEILRLRELKDLAEQKIFLIKKCKEKFPSDFCTERYFFPSKITEKFASQYIGFEPHGVNGFSFKSLLDKIWDNEKYVNSDSINALLIMLIDVSLYRVLTIIGTLSHGRFLYQLNMCVILDTMVIKPEKNDVFEENIDSILTEVSEKAKMRLGNLSVQTIWTLAMLNYKVHSYDSAIIFFEEFIHRNVECEENDIYLHVIHSKIYIGYCYEKSECFDKAIQSFECTIEEIKSENKISEEDSEKLIRELNHGLGHFYNERAIFGHSNDQDMDLLKARKHMFDALSKKADYYSCYGSLFHEYGDYKTAQAIFGEASQNSDIIDSSELLNELQFYIAQTNASLAQNEDKQIEQVEDNFKKFENYCKATYNYDGIVHARIFKVRTFLRKLYFSSNNIRRRERIGVLLDDWYKELKEYSLSSYASESIKIEYDKILRILKIFMSLYADTYFEWHAEDLLYNLRKFMQFMPSDALMLDYSPDRTTDIESNLYQISLGGLWIWCVGSKLLSNERFKEELDFFGTETQNMIAVSDKHSAHISIQGNGKPDLVVLMPPSDRDSSFEQEIGTIKNSLNELYFVYCPDSAGFYGSKWFETNISNQGKKYTCYSAYSVNDALIHAYCLRSFEILRKELLRPIPLFSLAPTHFSASYDFQLGEPLDICVDSINEHNDDSKNLRESLSFIDDKYSRTWIAKVIPNDEMFYGMKDCTPGIMCICCPAPLSLVGIDNYIGYYVNDFHVLESLGIPYRIDPQVYYTIKALPSYQKNFWDLEKALRSHGNACEQDEGDTCTVYDGGTLLYNTEGNNIPKLCRSILSVIFNKDIERDAKVDRPFKCILKKEPNTGSQRECYIYIILLQTDVDYAQEEKTFYCPLRSVTKMKKNAPTIFVTYSWEKPSDSNNKNKYLTEVINFVAYLRENGYDATFDLELYKKTHNWTGIMTEGLQREKIIVLLSREYKQKADDWKKRSGVKFESNALVERFSRDPENIILAKLPSQKNLSYTDVLPICFAGENVIDLSSSEMTDGYNQLLLTLNNNSILGNLPPVNPVVNKGRTL